MRVAAVIIACGRLVTLPSHGQTAPRITQILPTPGIVGNLSVADVDRDGDMDILVDPHPSSRYIESVDSSHFMLLENTGNRTFAPLRTGYLPPNCRLEIPPILGDFTSSPGMEWLITLQETKNGLPINRAYSVRPDLDGQPVPLGAESESPMQAIDLDGDGSWELLLKHPSGNGINILNRQPDGSYGPVSGTATFPGTMVPTEPCRMIDCDADGDLDMIWKLEGSTGLLIFERTGYRSFALPFEVTVQSTLPTEISDLDGDGLPDLHDKREPSGLISLGDLNTFSSRINQGGLSWGTLQTLGLPTDARAALTRVISTQGENATFIFTHTGESESTVSKLQFTPQKILSSSTIPALLPNSKTINGGIHTLADFDGDGHDDALCESLQEMPNHILFYRLSIAWGNGTGFSAPVPLHGAPQTAGNLLIGDWDGDNDSDVLIGPDTDGTLHMLSNDGSGAFTQSRALTELAPPAGSPADTTINQLASADTNGDGLPDLVISYQAQLGIITSSVVVVARAKTDGSFHPPVLPAGAFDFFTPSPGPFSQFIDFDGDGDVDLIGLDEWRENSNGTFAQESHPLIIGDSFPDALGNLSISPLPYSGDLDGDGAPEFINGCYGYFQAEGSFGSGRFISMAVGFNDGEGGLISLDEVPASLAGTDALGNPTTPGIVRFADLNGDALADLCTFEIIGSDALGNPRASWFWRRNPGNGSRTPSNWIKLRLSNQSWPGDQSSFHPFPDSPAPTLDFDGDGHREWVSPTGYLRPSTAGPVIATGYDFDGNTQLATRGVYRGAADFDGDGDADYLLENPQRSALFLMRNLTVDERCPITISLMAQGVLGGMAGPDADADGDNRSTFIELLEGTNPVLVDTANRSRFAVRLTATGPSFDRRLDAGVLGLNYRLESSTDLSQWTPAPETNAVVETLDTLWERVTLPDADNPARRFFRLVAETAPD